MDYIRFIITWFLDWFTEFPAFSRFPQQTGMLWAPCGGNWPRRFSCRTGKQPWKISPDYGRPSTTMYVLRKQYLSVTHICLQDHLVQFQRQSRPLPSESLSFTMIVLHRSRPSVRSLLAVCELPSPVTPAEDLAHPLVPVCVLQPPQRQRQHHRTLPLPATVSVFILHTRIRCKVLKSGPPVLFSFWADGPNLIGLNLFVVAVILKPRSDCQLKSDF